MYRVEFIRFVEGRVAPDIVDCLEEQFPDIAAAHTSGTTLFATMRARGAQGFRIIENGERVVSHWVPETL